MIKKAVHARALALASAYAAAYLLLEWLCYARPVLMPGITPWHPQAGLTIAFLTLVDPAWSALTAVVAFAAHLLIRPTHVSLAALTAVSVWVSFVSAMFALWLRRRPDKGRIRTTVDAVRFAFAAATVAMLVAAGFIGIFLITRDVPIEDALRGIARYGLADLNGMLMLTPLLLIADPRPALKAGWRDRRGEIVAQIALVLSILALIFALPDSEQLRFLYLLFVPVIWIALRWDWTGALPAVLIIQSALIFAAEEDLHTPRFIDTQVLMLTLTLTALLLGSVVAERRRSEAQLRERGADLSRAMRFAVAGELASATAHELNQPMTALVSYLDSAEILARSPTRDEQRLSETVRKAAAEALRASEVLHRLRNFYIGGQSRRERIRPESLCHTVAATFAERLKRAGITLEVFADPALPEIVADETQLHIVLHNLIANAIDAVVQKGGESRRIEVWVETDGRQLMFIVEDSGPGLDPVIADRLFEAFVTSKPDGMGLGLAISRSLVRASGGELASAAGERLGGARLQVVLPLASQAGLA